MTTRPELPRSEHATAVIVLLAAGASLRYGGIKQLADLNGEAMVHRTARIALASGARVLVVAGANAEQVTAALSDLPLAVVYHRAWIEGMGSSLAAGIRQVQAHYPFASGALLCLADQPLFKSAWLADLLAAHSRSPKAILATEIEGMAGPPVLFPSAFFGELALWSGAKGAQAVLQREADRVLRFPYAGGIDVDTPEDLCRACEILDASRLN